MIMIKDIKQGTKFEKDGKIYMKLPDFSSCRGYDSNAVDLTTGTMIYFSPLSLVDKIK